MYTEEEVEALIQLNSFMLNEVTEPAMRLFKKVFADSCPFVYNIEYAVHHKQFFIIKRDNSSLDSLDPKIIFDFNQDCDKSVLAFPVNCFEDKKGVWPVVEDPNGFGHANLIMVNRKLQTVEHFDPHGSKMNQLSKKQQTEFENAVRNLFVQGPWAAYEYVPPRNVCPTEGIQNLMIMHGSERRIHNTCRIWCYQFLMERLAHPELHVDEINRRNLAKLKADNPVTFSLTIDKFIIDFIKELYEAIQVTFEHKDKSVCLRWPQDKHASSCIAKSKLSSTTKSTKSRRRRNSGVAKKS